MSQELWAIVCVDLHGAYGFFVSEKIATMYAAKFTVNNQDGHGCTFYPVPFQMATPPQKDSEQKVEAVLEDRMRGGYL